MILLNAQALYSSIPPSFSSPSAPKFSGTPSNLAFPSPNVSIFSSEFRPTSSSFRCCCFTNKNDNVDNDVFEAVESTSSKSPENFSKKHNREHGFSMLSPDIPWDSGSIWSTMAGYFFSLHVPLSFGGLSVVSQLLHQPILDPETKAVSLLLIETMELVGALALLCYTAKPQYELFSFFSGKNFGERNWIQASILGFGFLAVTVLLTSLLADRIIGPKDVNPILKEILSSSSLSKASCFFLYCFITPMLEETVYRGFLLTSLASKIKWQQAVVISSCIFSAAHFSAENSLQLFLVGCVLGCAYSWTGSLASSFTIHSVYNAAILLATILS